MVCLYIWERPCLMKHISGLNLAPFDVATLSDNLYIIYPLIYLDFGKAL
jgi:hypothetical protein